MGFLELRRQCGISHEVRQGAQGASHVAPGYIQDINLKYFLNAGNFFNPSLHYQ